MTFKTNQYSYKPNTRKAVRYYMEPNRHRHDLSSSLYAYMFTEDLHLGVMPIGGYSEDPIFTVKIEPSSEEIERLISMGLRTHHERSPSLTKTVCDFIEEAVHVLAFYGKAYYEIIYSYNDNKRNEIQSFEIERIHNEIIKDTCGFFWQLIPKKITRAKEEYLKKFILLPKKDILVLRIPNALGGLRKYRRLLSNLQWISKCTIPQFAMNDMAIQKRTKGYDFSIYRENQEKYIAAITKHIGWMARGTFVERTLEFYQIYRYMLFQKTRAVLREYVLHKLNIELEIIGNKMGFKAKVKLEGISSSTDYDNYMKQLMDGSMQFSEAAKLIRT